jgi:hypothetical protein
MDHLERFDYESTTTWSALAKEITHLIANVQRHYHMCSADTRQARVGSQEPRPSALLQLIGQTVPAQPAAAGEVAPADLLTSAGGVPGVVLGGAGPERAGTRCTGASGQADMAGAMTALADLLGRVSAGATTGRQASDTLAVGKAIKAQMFPGFEIDGEMYESCYFGRGPQTQLAQAVHDQVLEAATPFHGSGGAEYDPDGELSLIEREFELVVGMGFALSETILALAATGTVLPEAGQQKIAELAAGCYKAIGHMLNMTMLTVIDDERSQGFGTILANELGNYRCADSAFSVDK